MHGCSLGSALLVNAEVDSMGGVVDGGVGIGTKTSPRRAAIEKAQVELRQEYDVREERRRELEFLEKGGNPLDFKFGNAASVSVQSTSLTDHPPEQFVTSEAKGSFALTASPHGDSVESSGRPGGPTICEPNCADNLLLFDGENDILQGEKNTVRPTRSNIAPSEQSSQLDGSQNAKESGDSTAFGLPEKAYKRRNRSRPNRDGARSSSNDVVLSRGGHVLSLPLCHGLNDVKGSVLSVNNHKDNTVSLNYNSKPTSPNGSMALKALPSDGQVDMALDNVQAVESTTGLTKVGLPECLSDFNASKSLHDNQQNQQSQVDGQKVPPVSVGLPQSVDGREHVVSAGLECPPCIATKTENQTSSGQRNGFSDAKGDKKSIPNEGQISSAALSTKGLDSESSCTQTSVSLDGNIDSGPCNNLRNVDSNGKTKEKASVFVGPSNMEGDDLKEKNDKKVDGSCAFINDENSVRQIHQDNGPILRAEEELHRSGSSSQNEVKCPTIIEGMEANCNTASQAEKKHEILMAENSNPQKENDCSGRLRGSIDSNVHDNSNPRRENSCGRLQGSMDLSNTGLLEPTLSHRGSNVAPEKQTFPEMHSQLATKAHEDSILEEARIIEAKRKRIAELSVGTLPSENHQRSHWDFVVEEMAWLANDFAQERLWKITAATQLCHRIASNSRSRFEEQSLRWKQQKVAHSLAKAIMEFWHSAEETSEEVELPIPETDSTRAVRGYAVRFLKYNASLVPLGLAEAPMTPDRISDLGIQEMSWEDHFTEENLFYTVPPGAMETYRKSIESHLAQVEKTGSSIHEEVETSTYDAPADFGSLDNAYEEDEGETSYYLPGGFEGSRQLRFGLKRRKNSTKSYAASSYDPGTDFIQCMENKVGNQPSVLMGKRPANSLNVGLIPTKRMRTASRQRVLGPFSAVSTGGVQGPIKTDASSGDTNSFQDDQSTLHGGSQIPNSLEVESLGDFEKQLPFDSTEVSKPKKKKKAKHLSSSYDQRWQLDNNFQIEQRDYSKKRLDSHQFESNGSGGLFGQPTMKRPKMMRQSLDNSFDNISPMTGSIPSPVASQMSNMSNPNKLIKILGGRDRGRKAKSLKIPAGQPGSGSPWSLFEDQALVVLVHDMGPNWELVSDAINGTLQFKCIFRKPKECKERHKILMDRTAGDGADSAEDSGSSQPYPSTLPGIPKGSARQLFQRLQGPMEEDLIKSHFKKIIMISKKQHYSRGQNDNQDSKPILPHNSHKFALSQVSPNNLNGGPPLTPLDLCDTTAPSTDILAHQGSHASGLAISNQGTVASVIPASGTLSSLQGSSNMVLGSNFSSPSGPLGASVRDGRYGVPRSGSLSIDEQQRMQQYNHMFSGRNIQQSSLSVSGAPAVADRGVRMLSGGNGMGIMCGINRSMPMARPGFQGIAPSSVLNSGSMLSSSMGAMPNPVVHSGVGCQGNSLLRPRDALNMMRPGQNSEHQRQMMVPELQMQVTQGNSQGVPPIGGLNSAFSNQTSPPPVQTYPLHQQQHQLSPQQSHALSNPHHPHLQGPNHASGTQQQAYAMRVAKERQLQQRLLQQQQQQQHHQQFAASNALMPHVQSQPQLPISSSLQNSSPVQPQAASAPVSLPPTQSSSMTPMSQHQQKLHMPPHGLNRNPQTGGSGMTNQMGKQRQRQPPQQQSFQQSGRHHPQQRQHSQSQQQAKLIKGLGRGNVLMHQNLMTDPSLLNGLSTTPGGQSVEKAEQVMHLMQGQGLYPGSGLNPVQPSKPLMPHCSNQPLPPQKMYSGQPIPSSKQVQQMSSHSDSNNNHGHAALPAASGHTLPTSHQAVTPSVMSSANHHQLQPHQKLVNQNQPAVQRVFQQNCQLNSDPPSKGQADKAQADQKPMNNTSQMGTAMVMPQPPIDTAVSPSGAQWKATDQVYDSGLPNPAMQLAPVGSPSLTNSSGSEPMPTVSLGQGQSSSSLPSLGHNIGAQWQQQSQLQPPSTPPPQTSQQ